MKSYRSHKEVRAARIVKIDVAPSRLHGVLTLDDGQVVEVRQDWLVRFNGRDGDLGYYVEYRDGFASWSPSKAFEEGYTLVDERPSQPVRNVCPFCRKPVDGEGSVHPVCFWRDAHESERKRASALAAELDKARRTIDEMDRATTLTIRYRVDVLGVTLPPECP
jgi:hypothetical protein